MKEKTERIHGRMSEQTTKMNIDDNLYHSYLILFHLNLTIKVFASTIMLCLRFLGR